jgi:carboxymethylenebutenolidase
MSFIDLTTSDGHTLNAYVAKPSGTPRGALVVVQEIFGVNPHIRSVADGYAADGYLSIAPAIFDRIERNVELGYDGADLPRAYDLMNKMDNDKALLDIAAAIKYGASAGKVGIVGYCKGGQLSWLAACGLDGLACAITYYGGGMPKFADLKPRCPVLSHFGENDAHIPLQTVEDFRGKQPGVRVELYPADHGFNRDVGASYEQASAKLARQRSIDFLRQHVG